MHTKLNYLINFKLKFWRNFMRIWHNILTALIIASSLFVMSCGDDDYDDKIITGTPDIPAAYGNLIGTFITSDTTWSGNQTLTGKYYVMPGVTLTIEKGSTISFTYHNNDNTKVGAIITLRADATNYDTPQPSGKLVAVGTSNEPIIFTSAKGTKEAGDWGGIILIGEAPNNIPGGEGDVEGFDTSIKYGGTNSTDNSGSLSYVRIEYCGFGIAPDSEINGLSLYSVGSETNLDHIQVYKCTDDGFEFFGGSVNTKYLVSAYNDDDSFDMDEGWNGKNQFWLAVQAPGADNGFESDGRKVLGEGDASNPTIYNATLYGFGTGKDASDKNYGMRLREDFQGMLHNFVISNFAGINWKLESNDGDVTSANFDNGNLHLANTVFWGNNLDADTPSELSGFGSADDETRFLATTQNNHYASPLFQNASNFNFALQNASPALENAATPPNDGFFDASATYRGAFGTTNWASEPWVRWDDSLGELPNEVPEAYEGLQSIGTVISQNTTWSGNQTLTGKYYVLPGITLTIEKGSNIAFTYHDGNSEKVGAIITLKADATNFSSARPSGKLVAEGTETEPIVLTSAKGTKEAGDWGGVILVGEAPNNIPGGEGDVEGLPEVVKYGGSNSSDNSGSLSYVRIEYCGFGIAPDSEINGLSLYSVGSETNLDHIQVYKCTDDGFEFFGGSVNTKYLISAYNDDDSFDMDEGWNGKNQFWLAVQAPGADNGFESDGRKVLGEGDASNPTIYNATLYGFGTGKDASDKNYGMRLREDFSGKLHNFIVSNFAGINWKLESGSGDITSANFDSGALELQNFTAFGNNLDSSTPSEFNGFNDATDETRFLAGANNNAVQDPMFTDASINDFSLQESSPALTGATPPNDGFFDSSATHQGAIGSDNWTTKSWVRWND
ncbi:MAG: hypothetical protein DWQ06_13950 [Calditrichaeota bacterium]|nr:MAG: hypothetical protein DWQ06_13950 [Calditrichota bacterium]